MATMFSLDPKWSEGSDIESPKDSFMKYFEIGPAVMETKIFKVFYFSFFRYENKISSRIVKEDQPQNITTTP